ncbi:MAG: AAA family ATPase [Actinomycetota bacterium]
MIISSLRLHNFRQYRGDQTLSFSTDPERNVTIVVGANGAGKTGLFLALNWCLYAQGASDAGPLLSWNLSPTEREEGGFVEVQFRHGGIQYVARRGIQSLGDSQEEVGELQLLELRPGGRAKPVLNPEQMMNEILPIDARRYFFFDGERINDMTKAGHGEQVREAMRSVLKLKVLERSIFHLGEVEKDLLRAVKQSKEMDSESAGLIEAMENLRGQIQEARSRRDEVVAEIESNDRQLEIVAEKLKSFEGFREIMVREAEIDTLLAAKDQRCTEIVDALSDVIVRSGPSIASQALTIAQQILDEKRRRGEIPSNIRRQLIDDLLREGKCICGRELDAPSRRILDARRESAASSEVEDVVLTASGHIASLHGLAQRAPQELLDALQEYEGIRSTMDELQREKEGLRQRVSEDLRTRPAGEVGDESRGLDETRRLLELGGRDLNFELGQLQAGLAQLELNLEHKRDQLERTQHRSSAATREKRRYALAFQAREAAEELLQRFHDDMRQRIEDMTDEIFKSLVWKQGGTFQRVKILGDSRMDVVGRSGESAFEGLSAGERQVLSLSFIVAMSRVTGEEAPLVIDTPFGRLSEDPLDNIAERLPFLSGQLVLLVTDRELEGSARRSMKDRIGGEFFLSFDQDTDATLIQQRGPHE